MTRRHLAQWAVWLLGLYAHGFSIGTLWTDDDTKLDRPDNWQLDIDDADGVYSDGAREGWQRWQADPSAHNAKNYTREVIEVWHPKTTSRIMGFVALASLLIGAAIGGMAVWIG